MIIYDQQTRYFSEQLEVPSTLAIITESTSEREPLVGRGLKSKLPGSLMVFLHVTTIAQIGLHDWDEPFSPHEAAEMWAEARSATSTSTIMFAIERSYALKPPGK